MVCIRFCYMPPFNGKCEIPQQKMGRGAIVVGEKRSGYEEQSRVALKEKTVKKEPWSENIEVERTTQHEHVKSVQGIPATVNKGKDSSNGTLVVHTISGEDEFFQMIWKAPPRKPRIMPLALCEEIKKGASKVL
ncbi:hypothetical protein GQ55_4G081800 [Panicum hallii var. hallii]|uniref:Uncharacterized protein n=1 Tax=Panicum hallii var. hallii TaxID=1504633 RepID=A0A2T7DWG5_9POAL|nr:hypothetical protein GQ55_4G081800 [Panicum hallii var. hallii]